MTTVTRVGRVTEPTTEPVVPTAGIEATADLAGAESTVGAESAGGTEAPLDLAALINEAMNKSDLMWIDVTDDRVWPAWHVWDDGTAYVVSGPGEQPLPWLPKEVRLILRSKDTGGRLLTIRAKTEIIYPGMPEWDHAAALLKAERLNAPDDSVTRWAEHGTITALVPFGAPLESPGDYSAADLRAVPARTTATTTAWRPWHWGGRKGRKDRNGRRGSAGASR
jgi:hypothetical protein